MQVGRQASGQAGRQRAYLDEDRRDDRAILDAEERGCTARTASWCKSKSPPRKVDYQIS